MKRIIFFLLILSITISSASAIKISSRVTIPYEPGEVFENEVCVWPGDITHVKLHPHGELSEHIWLEITDLDLSEGPGCVPYRLTMPETMDRPGTNQVEIRATEQEPAGRQSQIIALVTVAHQIRIEVPYPGKYLETSFSAGNAEAGDEVLFNAKAVNKGNTTIDLASGEIKVFDNNGNEIGSLDTNSISGIDPGETVTFYGEWDSTGYTSGDYSAELDLFYDGDIVEASTNFKLGSLDIRLAGHTKKVYKKGIVPFGVTAESYWSQAVPGVKAIIIVHNGTNEFQEFETLSQTVQPWQKRSLKGYLDTTELDYRNYSLRMNITFPGGSNVYERNLEVVREVVPTVEEPGVFSGLLTNTKFLLISTIVLALITLLLVIKVFFLGKREETFK